jgi:hypothetical protein
MRFLKYLYLFCLVLSTNAFASAPDTLWTRTFGGTSNDGGISVQQTKDSGFIISGRTNSFGAGNEDVYLIKTNSLGDTMWTKTYGGTYDDYGFLVQQTQDSGFIIAGGTSSLGAGEMDVYLIKTNSSGDTLWTKTFGGTSLDYGYSVQQTEDGGFIITGITNSFGADKFDVYLIRANSLGDTLWTKTYGGSGSDCGYAVQQTKDDGFIITGPTSSFAVGSYAVYLIKTNSSGDTLWTKTFSRANYDGSVSIQQTQDSGLIIAGYTGGDSEHWDVYFIRTNSSGDTLWTRTYGGTKEDEGYSTQQTSDGGFIIAGRTFSFGMGTPDSSNVYLIRTNSSGDTLWTKTFGGVGTDYGYSVQQTSDGGFIIVGYTTSFGAGNGDVYLIRLGKETGIEEQQLPVVSGQLSVKAFPDPFVKSTIISYTVPLNSSSSNNYYTNTLLTLYDLSGSCVKTLLNEQKPAGSYNINLSANKLKAGIYFLTLSTGTSKTTRKLTIIK